MKMVRRVPQMGRCLCPEKCRRRGEGAGAEDREAWPGQLRSDAANRGLVAGAPAVGWLRDRKRKSRHRHGGSGKGGTARRALDAAFNAEFLLDIFDAFKRVLKLLPVYHLITQGLNIRLDSPDPRIKMV